jgi:succinyl-CoA synthetase beta subunit
MEIKGHTVCGLMAEEMAASRHEVYLSLSLNGENGKPLLIASPMGGMDIEQAARERPDTLLTLAIDPFAGMHAYQHRMLAHFLPMADAADLKATVDAIHAAMKALNATLIEINPLGVVNGKLMALDAKIVLDDDAERLNADLIEKIKAGRGKLEGYSEPVRENNTITFVPLSGDIGLISDGAGTGMLTLDLVADAGGTVASFCELGGITDAQTMHRAMEKTLFPGHTVKSLLIVLIGGFNRMDDMADGITRYMSEHSIDVPVFTRMCGTMEEEGFAIMKAHGLRYYTDLMETVRLSVDAAGGNRDVHTRQS